MAKKRQRRTPQVPRSNPGGRAPKQVQTTSTGSASSPARTGDAPRVVRPAQSTARPDFSAEYAYVRKDLTRILVLAVLLFGGMGILRIIGF